MVSSVTEICHGGEAMATSPGHPLLCRMVGIGGWFLTVAPRALILVLSRRLKVGALFALKRLEFLHIYEA